MHSFHVFTFTLLLPLRLLAATDKPPPISVDDLVAQTLAANPEILFYQSEIIAAKANRAVAGKLPNPELSLEVGRKSVRSSDASASGVAWAAALAQPIEWSGRLGLRKAIANSDIGLAELGLSKFKSAVAAKVKTLAYSLAAQQERAAAADEVENRLVALRDVIVQRDSAGVTPLLETKVIEATSVVVQKKAGDTAIEMQKALLELNQLRGRRADTQLVVQRAEFAFPHYPSISDLLAVTLARNYEIKVRIRELEQQGLKVALSKNERYPTFTVGPMVSQERAGEKETVAGVALSVPLPLWNNGKDAVTAADARRLQAQASLVTTQRDIERQVTEAALLYETHRQRLATWKTEAVRSFREAASLADRHYRLGAVEIATYVELQEKYLEAVDAINETKAEALEAALKLEQLAGYDQSMLRRAEPSASTGKSEPSTTDKKP